MVIAAVKLILVIGSWFLTGYFIVPILFRKIIKYISEETLTIVSIALCLSMSVTAAYFNYSAALGAFIMGSILSETPIAYRIKQLTSPLRDVFAAVFFISIGMFINVQSILQHWPLMLAISGLAMIAKISITSISTFLTGQSVNTSVRTGFSMAPVGEFSFIIMSLGLSLNVTSLELYQMVIGVAAITTLVTPYLMRWSGSITEAINANLSARSKYFLDSYSAWVYRALVSYKKQVEYRKFVFRIIINAIVIAVIFTLVHDYLYPHFINLIQSPSIAKAASWIVALLLALPSIWGMVFSFSLINKGRQIPALFLSSVLAIIEIIVLSITYFNTWYIPIIIAAIVGASFIFIYRQLESSYQWVELHLTRVLKRKQHKKTRYEELAPWDTHLVEVIATNYASDSLVGKTLSENRLRQRFGINIVAIRRGSNIILAPRGEEKILLQDELIILGNDEQIDSFKKIAEDAHFQEKKEDMLGNFILSPIILEPDTSLVGKTIRDSHIRQQTGGLVVGLERNGHRMLNPDPSTVLKPHDLLLVVGQIGVVCNNIQEGQSREEEPIV